MYNVAKLCSESIFDARWKQNTIRQHSKSRFICHTSNYRQFEQFLSNPQINTELSNHQKLEAEIKIIVFLDDLMTFWYLTTFKAGFL